MKINKNKSFLVLGISLVALFVVAKSSTTGGGSNFKTAKMSKLFCKVI